MLTRADGHRTWAKKSAQDSPHDSDTEAALITGKSIQQTCTGFVIVSEVASVAKNDISVTDN